MSLEDTVINLSPLWTKSDRQDAFKLAILWILKELLADKAGMDPQFFHTVIKVATSKLKCTEAELLQEIRDAAL